MAEPAPGLILLTSDDPELGDELAATLAAAGLAAQALTPAQATIDPLVGLSPDLLLIAAAAPAGAALDLCRQLRADPRLAATALLGVAGPGYPAGRRDLLGAGASDALSWPDQRPELALRARRLIDAERQRRDRAAELAAHVRALAIAERQREQLQLASDRIEQAEQTIAAIYRTLAEHFPDGALFLFDHDLRYVVAHGRALAQTGFDAAGLIGRRLADVVNPEGYATLSVQLRSALAGHESTIETVFAGRWFESRFLPLRDEGGRVRFAMSVTIDISERRRVAAYQQTQLAVSRALTTSPSLDEAAPAILQAFGAHLGWDIGELWLYNPADGMLHCAHTWARPELRLANLDAYRRPRRPDQGMIGAVWTNGEPIWIEEIANAQQLLRREAMAAAGLVSAFAFTIGPHPIPDGVLVFLGRTPQPRDPRLTALLPDLGLQIGQFHRRRLAEAHERLALHRSSTMARLAARLNKLQGSGTTLSIICEEAAAALAAPIALLYLHGSPQSRSADLAAAVGLAPGAAAPGLPEPMMALLGQGEPDEVWSLRIAPRDSGQDFLDGLASAGLGAVLITQLYRKETRIGWLLVGDGSPQRDFSADDRRTLVAVADLANQALTNAWLLEELQAERALLSRRVQERTADLQVALDRLARAMRAKDEFMASMSHELRTPLNAILGLSEILRDGIYGGLNERQRRALETIDASGLHLLNLINDILDLTKIEAGHEELSLSTIEPVELAELCCSLVEQSARSRQIQLVTSIAPGMPLIQADGRRLKQILMNLLSNAIKFTPPGGQVGVELSAGVSDLTFTVWDTGIGMDPEQLRLIFQAFVQVDSGLNRQHNGSGLGLALVARLCRIHGGGVRVRSAPGQGSRFSVTLPLRAAPSQAPAMPRQAPMVLLIDDQLLTSRQITDRLAAAGYRGMAVAGVSRALEISAEDPPAALIVDLQAGRAESVEVLIQLRASPALAGLPTLAVSAVTLPDTAELARSAGAADYLPRPIGAGLLEGWLARYLSPAAEG